MTPKALLPFSSFSRLLVFIFIFIFLRPPPRRSSKPSENPRNSPILLAVYISREFSHREIVYVCHPWFHNNATVARLGHFGRNRRIAPGLTSSGHLAELRTVTRAYRSQGS